MTDARFLTDGQLGLQRQLPGDARQVGTLDPAAHLAATRLGAVAPGAPMAIRPDGQAVAVLRPLVVGGGSDVLPRCGMPCRRRQGWLTPSSLSAGRLGAVAHPVPLGNRPDWQATAALRPGAGTQPCAA